MSEDQENNIEEPLNPDESGVGPMKLSDQDLGIDGTIEDFMPIEEEKPIDDTGKTPEQIMAELGITKEEFERVFPEGYEPLKMHPSKMESKDLLEIAKGTNERLKKHKQVKNEDSVKMPSVDETNQKNAEGVKEDITVGAGATFTLDGLLELIEKSKTISDQQKISDTTRRNVLNEVKHALREIVETSEMETFNAKVARQLYLNKIKTHSRLKEVLQFLKRCALDGKYETQIDYLHQYDKIKLLELGFKLTKHGGQTLAYTVAWDDGAKQ